MSESMCGTVRELIPERAGGRISEGDALMVDEHVGACEECAAELRLASLLLLRRTEVPEGLAARIQMAVRRERVAVRRPAWGLTAAAVAALALGIGIRSGPESGVGDAPAYAVEIQEAGLWSEDDALIAGAPSLDGLSDEALDDLLEELLLGRPGGAA